VRDACSEATEEIKHEVSEVSEVVFDVVAEDPKEEHVSGDVNERRVQEHRREDRYDGLGQASASVSGKNRDCMVRDDPELHHEGTQGAMADGEFPHEDKHIQDNQKIIYKGSREGRLIVAKRNHLLCNHRLLLSSWNADLDHFDARAASTIKLSDYKSP
jgi:hypothetical protein